MKVTFDKVADAIFFSLQEGKVARTVPLSNVLNIDMDENGHVLGIEVLDVSTQFETNDLHEIEKRVMGGIPFSVTAATPMSA